ncbi:MAG: hypothetical protein ACRC7N_17325 [Clostridium sp.]
MKKFLIIASTIFFLLIFVNKNLIKRIEVDLENLFYGKGGVVESIVIRNGELYINKGTMKEERLEKITINGINIDPSKPGAFPNDEAVTKEEFLLWFYKIKELKINCIRVKSLMGKSFYNALNSFNENNPEPIYILQGIYFDEEVFKNGYNLYDKEVLKGFKTEIRKGVSAVHGDIIKENFHDLDHGYTKDVSKYVIGYTVGVEWAAHDIIYQNIINEKRNFEGKYFKATINASPFEEYLAYLANYLVDYEMGKYREQKIISFVSQGYNYLRGKEQRKISEGVIIPEGAVEINPRERDYIDLENIEKTNNYKENLISSYNIYPDVREDFNYNKSVMEYISRIKRYTNLPMLVSEFGMPTGRNTNYIDFSGVNNDISEKDQGEILVKVHKEIEESNILGGFIFEWQDSWYKSAHNTSKNRDLLRTPYWNDRETDSQWYGLLSFNGDNKEKFFDITSNNEPLNSNENIKLYVDEDERYMYVDIELENMLDGGNYEYYLDFDVTPKSGAMTSNQFNLAFETPVDFIVKIGNNIESEVLVQKYYSIYDFNTSLGRLKLRPNTKSVSQHMDEFVKIKVLSRDKVYIAEKNTFLEEEYLESGKLQPVITNKDNFIESGEYKIGEKSITVRIPYGLLNFRDPSSKIVEDDFYEDFRFKGLNISKVGIGVTIKEIGSENSTRISSKEYELRDWNSPKYKERLKDSYYIFKDYINGRGVK